jgi:signal transduction histidine kinase/ligand-binding sensor domain-containing protein
MPTPLAARIHEIAPLEGGGALIGTDRGVYRLDPGGAATQLDPSPGAVRLRVFDDDSFALLLWLVDGTRLVEIAGGERREHPVIPGRAIDVVRRGETLWVATDRYLAAFRPGRTPEIMGPEDGLPAGGALLVDREGSLWLGTFVGLVHFPEPDTIVLNDEDGLPSSHTRLFNRTREGIWLSTWQGSALISDGPSAAVLRNDGKRATNRGCVDARGVLWSSKTDWDAQDFALLERLASGEVEHRLEGFRWITGCAAAPDGGLWIATTSATLRSKPRGGLPVRIGEPPPVDPIVEHAAHRRVFEDSSGRLWVARGGSICHADAREAGIGNASWSCDTIAGMRHATVFVEPSPGVIWMGTAGGGVLRREGDRWQTIPASIGPLSADVFGLRASPRGGVWVTTHGIARRVEDRPDLAEGWRALEEITGWHGIPEGGKEDVLELEDGTIWVTTGFGAARLPAEARHPPDVPAHVELAEMIVDGMQLSPREPLDLPFRRNRLELHFSALSYRDPARLRYRIRTGRDEEWADPVGNPFIRLVDLSPGDHRVEVAASLDSMHWSPSPAVLEFDVGRPWFLQAWAIASFAALVAACAYGVHRARVASLLRLERQRTRIARDLHDEMGSGLGSIGILAEVAAGDRLDERKRRDLSAQISETVRELGATLDEIVWSLRPGAQTLDSLAAELAGRGARMFPDGTTSFRTEFPDAWPGQPLAPEVRRNVQRIAVEALHNAARHSMARSVSLTLAPHGRRWRLRVSDDGNGLPLDAAVAGNGLGLSSMRARATQIGASIAWDVPPAGGTVVTLEFDLTPRRRLQAG